MEDNTNATSVDEDAQDTDSPSLKEKINAINFVKWGKRAVVTSGLMIVAAVVVTVVRNKTDIEE